MSRVERREYLAGTVTAVVLAAILVLTALANRRALDIGGDTYHLTAEFDRTDGIYVGSPVWLAGIAVGIVAKEDLDALDRARLTLRFNQPISIPEDSDAVIETDGWFGSKHIELHPGGSDKNLPSGGRIAITQGSVIIEDLISHILDEAKAAHAQQAGGAARQPAQTGPK